VIRCDDGEKDGAMERSEVRVGTAGWTIPAPARECFPREGTQLERYAARFTCSEINSSFYRSHRPSTYERWAASVPASFRFSLKVPKTITHERRLVDAAGDLARFLDETAPLGEKRGVLLTQLPPRLAWDSAVAGAFFTAFRERYTGAIALEPRHASWFDPAADELLRSFAVARVAADPAPVAGAAVPGGWEGFAYYRLHGAPRMYYSAYGDAALGAIAERLLGQPAPAWCIFDNTASGAAAGDALAVSANVRRVDLRG
jgi:uncharacterized protein YecE (DUF72 family)